MPSLRSQFISTAKHIVASTLYATGALKLMIKVLYRDRPVVLMYHRVLPEGEQRQSWSHPGIIVSNDTFERHMALLSRAFTVISLQQYVESGGRAAKGGKPACLVTFDDGWIDTYTHAWPILRRHSIPALVFLPVDYIGTGRSFWQERVSRHLHLVYRHAQQDAAFRQRFAEASRKWGFERVLDLPAHAAKEAIAEIVRSRKADRPGDIQDMVDTMASFAAKAPAADEDVDAFMTWAQVREMAAAGTAFGAHGARHLLLTTMEPAAAEVDIHESRNVIDRELSAPPIAFSYPNGNWNAAVAAIVQRAGFKVAFTTPQHQSSEPFAATRVNIHQSATATAPLLFARIAGLF